MTKVKSTPKFWLLTLPILVGLGMALVVPTMARAQRLLVGEGLVPSSREASPAREGRQLLAVDSNVAPNQVNSVSSSFTFDLAASSAMTGVSGGSAAWGDYDNDGDLDILLTGHGGSSPLSSVYKNTGSGFTEDLAASSTLSDVTYSSAAWGDYDNDGDLDILLTGNVDSSNAVSSVYENTGSGFDVDVAASSTLIDVYNGSAAWGDYDNDGDLDILLTGFNGSSRFSSVYENTGSGFTENIAASSVLTGVFDGGSAWGDYDNDGDLDILLTGVDNGFNRLASVFKNIGSGFVEDLAASSALPGVNSGSAAWGDYDNDGDLDILLTGDTGIFLSSVYENTGLGFTEDIAASSVLTGVVNGSAAWGDYDNDGDLDILLTGFDGNSPLSKLYENTGSGFTVDIAASSALTGVFLSSAVWGDYDNDDDLDILLTGEDSSTNPLSSVFRNDSANANSPPDAPGGLSSSVDGGKVSLSWDPPSPLTYTSPYTALTYNLRVGTAPGLSDILPPMSCVGTCGISPDGYRQVPAMGAANHGLSATLNLPPGTYYWSVQAVDHTFSGSPWAVEGFFPSQMINLPLAIR